MVWQKGQSGNPNGRRVNKPLTDALRVLLSRPAGDDLLLPEGATIAHEIALNLLNTARKGDFDSSREAWNRIEGTPKQTIAGDDESDPISFRIDEERTRSLASGLLDLALGRGKGSVGGEAEMAKQRQTEPVTS